MRREPRSVTDSHMSEYTKWYKMVNTGFMEIIYEMNPHEKRQKLVKDLCLRKDKLYKNK